MTVLGIRYLTGYAAATDLAAGGPEWPPHPGRVFMALAAAHFESGADTDERRALEWIEAAPAPAIQASDATARTFHETYVPVNDSHGGILGRSRQPRSFPKARPENDTVHLVWPIDAPQEVRTALARLSTKVTRIGHSASLVQVWLVEDVQVAGNWLPGAAFGEMRLRVPSSGALAYLESSFNADEIERYQRLDEAVQSARGAARGRLRAQLREGFPGGPPVSERPKLNTWIGYARRTQTQAHDRVATGPFDPDFLVLAVSEGRALGLETTLQLTGALRNAAMKAAGEGPPEWLTGHTPEGKPSREPHAAFFPLPFVGHVHADGHLLGLGIALPRRLTSTADGVHELRERLGPMFFDPGTGEPRGVHLWREGVWRWKLERESRESPPLALRRRTWTGPARVWASATPVVFHHHPKRLEGDLERIALEAFASALLPQPEAIEIRGVAAHLGAGHASALPYFDAGSAGLCRYQAHMKVRFSEPVQGPVLVGRGRYRGYGLFAPLRSKEDPA